MYFVRKHAMVMFIADARLHTVKAECTLQGKSDIAIHNLWAEIQLKLNNYVFALDTEDAEYIEGRIETDAHSVSHNAGVILIPRHKRPENSSCILCSLEEHFKTEDVDLEFFEAKSELAEEYSLPFSASLFWIGAGSMMPNVLYTDKAELNGKTIIIGRKADVQSISNNHPVVAFLFDDGGTTEVPNDRLCRKMFLMVNNIGETGYAFD
jgi:hypothetical protein